MPALWALAGGVVSFVGSFCIMTMPSAVLMHGTVLFFLCLIWLAIRKVSNRQLSYVPVLLVGFVGTYGYLGYDAIKRVESLQARFPWTEVGDRLPRPPEAAPRPFSWATLRHLGTLDQAIQKELDDDQDRWSRKYRERDMRRLHSATVWEFINSPSFGATRAQLVVSAWRLKGEERHLEDREQPDSSAVPHLSPGQSTTEPPAADALGWYPALRSAIVDFANPGGFGVVDRASERRIGLFEPHAFSKRPPVADAFELKRLELVSLLLHEQPVVYLSNHLPAMEKARELPTRPLDEFEAFALAKLKAGEDLVLRQPGKGARVLGPYSQRGTVPPLPRRERRRLAGGVLVLGSDFRGAKVGLRPVLPCVSCGGR